MMECNREEALRAKEIAEKKFRAKDIAGAKKFALKAQNLYPALDGISQMLATLDMLLTSSEAAARGQMRDTKVNQQQQTATTQQQQLHGASSNGYYHVAGNSSSNLRSKKQAARNAGMAAASVPPPPPPAPHLQRADTFWTSCNHCRMQYEYLRIYLNHNLLCPSCREPFLAVETGYPTNWHTASSTWSPQWKQPPKANNRESNHHKKHTHTTPAVGSSGASGFHLHELNLQSSSTNFQYSTSYSTVTAGATGQNYGVGVTNYAYGKRTADFSIGGSDGTYGVVNVDKPRRKKRRTSEGGKQDNGQKELTEFSVANYGYRTFNTAVQTEKAASVSKDATDKARVIHRQDSNGIKKEFSSVDIRNMLIKKARLSVQQMIEKMNIVENEKLKEKAKALQKQQEGKNVNGKQKQESGLSKSEDGQVKMDKSNNHSKQSPLENASSGNHLVDSEKALVHRSVSIDVPDPDFHDFDKDRTERSFEQDQVWALYDDEDGMPRLYVLIQKILSFKPFKVQMSFLNSKSNSELSPLNWVGMGYTKTCGDFRVGRYKINDSINIFSHKVRWEKGVRGVIRIVPRKGETWALYRNWSSDWNEHTPDDVIYKYDMVEVLDDFNEKRGVMVTPLVKVAGFRSVFYRHQDEEAVKLIPREEMFRFSHQVPSCLLDGTEGQNAPKGCHELDPAATPLELLQIITEAKECQLTEASDLS